MANSHETQLVSLRAELKEWERAFAANHGGKKAGRDDIKRDSEIGTRVCHFGVCKHFIYCGSCY